jgi:hypothetical protein
MLELYHKIKTPFWRLIFGGVSRAQGKIWSALIKIIYLHLNSKGFY